MDSEREMEVDGVEPFASKLWRTVSTLCHDTPADSVAFQLRRHLLVGLKARLDEILAQPLADDALVNSARLFKIVSATLKSVQEAVSSLSGAEYNGEAVRRLSLIQLRGVLFPIRTRQLQSLVEAVFQAAFRANLCKSNQLHVIPNVSCPKTGDQTCACSQILVEWRQIIDTLRDLQLLDRIVAETPVELLQPLLRESIARLGAAHFRVSHAGTLEQWQEQVVQPWIRAVYSTGDEADERLRQLAAWSDEEHAKVLIGHSYAIVSAYPESSAAIVDLKRCLGAPPLRRLLRERLRADIERHLLNAAVSTTDILAAYTRAVRSLRLLDPSGVIMHAVCLPIRAYLRNRADTVRCIVSLLTDEQHEALELGAELMRSDAIVLDSSDDSDDDEAATDWRRWQPDPVDAPPGGGRRSRRGADIVSMLVGVYGSKELFVKEYGQLLSERLLRDATHNVETECRYLELLQNRFGRSEMHQCEVMLRDMKESLKIDSFVAANSHLKFPVSTKVISAHFWPKLREERLHLPADIRATLEAYGEGFSAMKASRNLQFVPHAGAVQLQLEMAEQTVQMRVSPFHAAVIWLFQQREEWSCEELARQLQAAQSAVARRLAWWAALGVLRETAARSGRWRLGDALPSARRVDAQSRHAPDDDADADDAPNAAADQLEQYWSYISNMIKTLGSLAAERVLTMLRMFASPGSEPPSLDAVNRFLQRKVRDGLLTHNAGVYKLPPK